ncbi:hypothetical protein N0V93_003350 [Gnomoniopsis smithogilvyi]|uniref:Uncharacterized protein n=1 Tax=Gnomoniopsis smithogilvyi TaxID=1191159 RepID=A0A9W8YYE3_9PEZI|nr:hypothetical protein N0V93_003350 [Gnomoniopsis smithogilvyi]
MSDNYRSSPESANTANVAGIRKDLESIQKAVKTISSTGDRAVPALDAKVIRLEKRLAKLEHSLRSAPITLTENSVSRAEMETKLNALSEAHSAELEKFSRNVQVTLTELRSNMVPRLEFEKQLEALSRAGPADIHLPKCQIDPMMEISCSPPSLTNSSSPAPQYGHLPTTSPPGESSLGIPFPEFAWLPLAQAPEEIVGDESHNDKPPQKSLSKPVKSKRQSSPPQPLKTQFQLKPAVEGALKYGPTVCAGRQKTGFSVEQQTGKATQ